MKTAIEVLQATLRDRRERRQRLEHHYTEREKLESDKALAELAQAIRILQQAQTDPAV